MSKANSFVRNTEANLNPGSVIALVVALLVIAAAIPIAVSSIIKANTTGWGAGPIALWGVLGLVVIAMVVVGLTRGIRRGGGA